MSKNKEIQISTSDSSQILKSAFPHAFISDVVESTGHIHLWQYGNIAVKEGKHPRVRECAICKEFQYVDE